MSVCVALTDIDWTLTRDVVAIIGTIGALAIGLAGLGTWRRQLHGTSKYEVARRAILLAYEMRDAIQAVRSPILQLRREEIDAGRRIEEEQRIYDERMQRLYEKWSQLRTIILETKAIWGEKAEAQFRALQGLVGTMRAEIWLHFWLKGAYAAPGATVDNTPERVAKNRKVIYWTSDDDEFSQKIDAAIHPVEIFFQRKMR